MSRPAPVCPGGVPAVLPSPGVVLELDPDPCFGSACGVFEAGVAGVGVSRRDVAVSDVDAQVVTQRVLDPRHRLVGEGHVVVVDVDPPRPWC